jgi:adenosylmethionine-8-amino-7-oxononanoate aminotransferase
LECGSGSDLSRQGLTSGYLSFSAAILSTKIAATILQAGYSSNGFTCSVDPVCAAAALANFRDIQWLGLISHAINHLAPYFQRKLEEIKGSRTVAEVWRNRGS